MIGKYYVIFRGSDQSAASFGSSSYPYSYTQGTYCDEIHGPYESRDGAEAKALERSRSLGLTFRVVRVEGYTEQNGWVVRH